MSKQQRIEELERKVIELEARLAVQESRPYPYYAYWQPNTSPQYPRYTYTTTSDYNEHNNPGSI